MRPMLIMLMLTCAGCTPVRPWERGRLAHDCMKVPVDALEKGHYGHVEAVREGSAGGVGEGGGGCGCN